METQMAREDRDHKAVRQALENEDWIIVRQQALLRYGPSFYGKLDLIARANITATQGERTIVVEVKSFSTALKMAELEKAVGQYLIYKSWLVRKEPNWTVFLAITTKVAHFFEREALQVIINDYGIRLLIVDAEQERIVAWK